MFLGMLAYIITKPHEAILRIVFTGSTDARNIQTSKIYLRRILPSQKIIGLMKIGMTEIIKPLLAFKVNKYSLVFNIAYTYFKVGVGTITFRV